jgi:hypothetical protein
MAAIARPDQVFTIIVNESARVFGCTEKLEQESRGLMGFHNFKKCPNCRIVSEGFELWGDNGHRQGGASDRNQLTRVIAHLAKKQWRLKAGGIMGYRFRLGGKLYYRGN